MNYFEENYQRLQGEPMQVDDLVHDSDSEKNFTIENSPLDLETLACSYKGYTKIQRLLFIAKHAPSVAVDAYKLAISAVQETTQNVRLYKEVYGKYKTMTIDNGGLPFEEDVVWIDKISNQADKLHEKYQNDLKTYKNMNIKENIRRAYGFLASHYINVGQFNDALKIYSRMRDYCSIPTHVANMCACAVQVSFYMKEWPYVLQFCQKAEASNYFKEKDMTTLPLLNKIRCARGVANMSIGNYQLAAESFLQCSIDNCDFPELMTVSNIAVYASLCALATFDRKQIQTDLIQSSTFKLMLELEPKIRDVVISFYKCQYSSCLSMLSGLRNEFKLDLYLSFHTDKLLQKIRLKALLQYTIPYKTVDMRKMAEQFKCKSVNSLEDELIPLILSGEINARIDSHNLVLRFRDTCKRSDTYEKCLQVAREHIHRVKSLSLRNAVMRAGIVVQNEPVQLT